VEHGISKNAVIVIGNLVGGSLKSDIMLKICVRKIPVERKEGYQEHGKYE